MIFQKHLDLALKYNLPIIMTMKYAGPKFLKLLLANRHKFFNGIIHDFNGNAEELKALNE